MRNPDPAAQAADTVERPLPNDSSAAGQARETVRVSLTRWRLPRLIDACVLAASELVTNAVRHGRPPIALMLRRRPHDLRLDVRDSDPHPIARRGKGNGDSPAADLPESGRGLDIIDAIADDTGSEHIPGEGKTVFASWRVER